MYRILFAICLTLTSPLASAWNGAGHRLVAAIAWQHLSPPTRAFVDAVLASHPDHATWTARGKADEGMPVFAEASTWPDDIRRDARFHDADREPPTPALPGLPDTARHKNWHYVDMDASGQVRAGELDRQIERLTQVLASSSQTAQLAYALPWLIHLVGDIHQPLHVGRQGDEGGNTIAIENPYNRRQPLTRLHAYWDDLPGPPWLRGKRLEQRAESLEARYPAPVIGDVGLWREESHNLLSVAYPDTTDGALPVISAAFNQQAHAVADRRIVEAGYRLADLLEHIVKQRVSRGTPLR